ncbi:hypothetical protein LTR78_006187 [Recurvomyces mirabilis]|uniref:Multicopper oxidase n=1 Tax=Recurvomyces mirabilis TaxID=574656 RepID=A0AAE0WLN5_9PEZI|nr:hypothetical protein LTR78_006187 [Recurvomyces mirabilis]KAK5152029.1 hypothetical protein LTS14_008803 [Recurvomyces mirabilis]
MKGVASVLAVAASVAPALAIPGWNRGDNNIVNVINEIEHAHPNGGAWGPPQGAWGNGRRPPPPQQHHSWGKPPAASSDVVVDPASGKSTGGTARPTGYSNVTSSAPLWNNATAPTTSYTTTYVTVTDVVSTYTTTYPYIKVSTTGSSTLSSKAITTSTVTTSYQSTITVTKTLSVKPAGPGGYGGMEPSSTPVNAVSTSPAGGNAGSNGGSNGGNGANGSPVSNVVDSSTAVYITLPITEISYSTSLAPVPWGAYTPSNYVSLPPAQPSSPASPVDGNGSPTTVIVTDYVTTYTTLCPYEQTHTTGGQTTTSTGTSTSTVTSSVHTTLTVTKVSTLTDGVTITPTAPVYGGSSSSSSPAGPVNGGSSSSSSPVGPVTTTVTSGYTTVTTITSVYTTTKPVTSTITTGSSKTISTGTTTETSTTTIKSTITISLTSTVTMTPTSSSSSTSSVVSPVTYSGSSSLGGSSSKSSSASSSSSGSISISSSKSSSASSSSTSPISPVTNSATFSSSLSQSSYTTYTTSCSENNTVTIHTHSQPLTESTSATLPPYGVNTTTSAGPTGSGSSSTSSTVSGPVSGSTGSASSSSISSSSTGNSSTSSTVSSPVTTSESSYTTYTTTCTENSTTILQTHSAPIYNSTTSTSPVVGPTGGSTTSSSPASVSASYSGNSTTTSPVVGPTGGSTTSSSTVTGPTSFDGNSTTSSVVGPTGGSTTSSSSTSVSESSYTTYTTTCTENGTTTLHTHSAPVTNNGTTTLGSISSTASGPATYSANSTTSSFPVGPTGGSTSSSSTVSGPVTQSANSTSSTSLSTTSFTTYTTLCTDNGTTTIHTHSAPIYNTTSTSVPIGPTGGSTTSSSTVSGSASYSGNATTPVGPTAPVTTSSSSSESSFTTYTTLCTENGTTTIHTHSAPVTVNGTTSSTAGPITTGGSSNIISYSTNSTSSLPTAPVTTSSVSISASLNITSSQPTAPITTSSSSSSAASNSTTSASKTSSSSSTSSCKALPTATGKCVPCEGQPGSDPNNFCGYTIKDNPYEVMPQTCVTREYNFELVNGTISPDGVPRNGLTVNGQFPGPQLTANWGDTITVHVKNSMANNGSTIHWHGIRQNYTNAMDGVASITQCPIAPGDTMTYTFRADNYGFSWYHAHISVQAYMGVLGPMVINGPKSVAGSFDEEIVVLTDWTHRTVDEMYDHTQDATAPDTRGAPTMDTGLINGMNIWGGADGAAGTTGERWSTSVKAGETKLFRILNSAIQSTFIFGLDGHSMQVIAADFVPIVPYTANTVAINPGQRYDVLITFNQAASNYWFRADIQQDCGPNLQWNNVKGIVSYSSVQAGVPSSTAWTYSPGCQDEAMSNLKPAYALDAGVTKAAPLVENVVIGANGQNLYKWSLNGVTFQSEWGQPTLESLVHNGTIPPFSGPLAITVPNLGEWVYIVIQSPIPTPHPIHLHGHDFYVLAQGFGTYSASTPVNLVNPPRRDTVMMPSLRGQAGYVVIAFFTDNPGAWLMHCHIGWHNAMGFALQIIEAQDLINSTAIDTCAMDNTCKKYNEYASEFDIVMHDSGV